MFPENPGWMQSDAIQSTDWSNPYGEDNAIKRQTIGLRMAAWLRDKVRDRGIGLRPGLYTGCACDDSAAEGAYCGNVALYKSTLPLPYCRTIVRHSWFQSIMFPIIQAYPLQPMQSNALYWDTSVDGWRTRTSSPPVCFDVDTRRTTDTSSHHWWSCVSGCCVTCLEFPSNFGQGNPVTACVPPEIEDSTVCHLFSGRLTVIQYSFVKCPW